MPVSQDWNATILKPKISEHIQMYSDKIRKLMDLAELYNISVDIDCLIADLVKAQKAKQK